MAIAKNPQRNQTAAEKEARELAFINKGGKLSDQPAGDVQPPEQNKKPFMIRIDPAMLERIDKAAKRLGLSRSAFIVSSAAKELERMEQVQ